MGIRCARCNKTIVKDLKYMQWLKLYCFLEILMMEGNIEAQTYETMVDALMFFKEFAIGEEKEDD